MIAVRLLSRAQYRAFLQQYGCELVDALPPEKGLDGFYGWAYWRTSWGHHFYVPEIGPDARCPEPRFYEILSEISAITPREE
jgi:hypothetical protein